MAKLLVYTGDRQRPLPQLLRRHLDLPVLAPGQTFELDDDEAEVLFKAFPFLELEERDP